MISCSNEDRSLIRKDEIIPGYNFLLNMDLDYIDVVLPEERDDDLPSDDLFNITSWGADITLRDIVASYEDGDILKPELQRKYVWDKKESSRFIESILLGLPVPSVFLANTPDGFKLIVDGYQRIKTIYDFYKGIWTGDNSVFALSNSERINSRWRGRTYATLSAEDQRRFRLYTIHAIIFEQKMPKNDSGLYQIFERINTSGKSLNPQEIRNCVYQGKMNNLLFKLNKNPMWRKLYGEEDENSRMLDLEFILRFIALSQEGILERKTKSISLKKELNDIMSDHKDGDDSFFDNWESSFTRCIAFIMSHIGEDAFFNLKNDFSAIRKKFYPTVFDSIMIATRIALSSGFSTEENLEARRLVLLRDEDYRNSITQGTMKIENIKTRIRKALLYLYDINMDDE